MPLRRSSLALALVLAACAPPKPAAPDPKQEAKAFLDLYASLYTGAYAVAADAQWKAVTDVTPEHDGARVAAGKALAAIQGDREAIERAQALLKSRQGLEPLQARQLDRVLLNAAESPGTVPEVVAERVEAEGRQSSTLDGFQFCLERRDGRCVSPVTANDIDDVLDRSRDLTERLAVWNASKEIGPALKPGLVELQKLRNQVAREMGYPSFFALQVADYGMTADEMMAMLAGVRRRRPAALRAAALLGEARARRALRTARPQADPRALDRQPLGAELARHRRGRRPGPAVQGTKPGVDREAGGAVLRLHGLPGSLPASSGSGPTSTRCRRPPRGRRTPTPRRGTSTSTRTSAR